MRHAPRILLFLLALSACRADTKSDGELIHSGEHAIACQIEEADGVTPTTRACVPAPPMIHYKDTIDGGDAPMTAGCHLEYSDMACMNRTNLQYGDECDPGDPTMTDLIEWWNTECHPAMPLDKKHYNCDVECKKINMNDIGCCEVKQIACGTNMMMDSAQCKCVAQGQNCP